MAQIEHPMLVDVRPSTAAALATDPAVEVAILPAESVDA
jgi:hypothetical protein